MEYRCAAMCHHQTCFDYISTQLLDSTYKRTSRTDGWKMYQQIGCLNLSMSVFFIKNDKSTKGIWDFFRVKIGSNNFNIRGSNAILKVCIKYPELERGFN